MTAPAALMQSLMRHDLTRRIGRIASLSGLTLESHGPDVRIGEICQIRTTLSTVPLLAEVVGLRDQRAVLMPYGFVQGIEIGSEVMATNEFARARVGDFLLGHVLDGLGAPLDGLHMPRECALWPLQPPPINPLDRAECAGVLETGVKVIDTMLTLAHGQRIGIFAGSGVGKSTLIEMIARHAQVDVHVVALVGERGREAHSLIERLRKSEAWRRTVVIVATSDQPALVRRRAAFLATAVAEYFCEQGRQVCLTVDSATRIAMAQREIGLSSGELPTARGYTPSVFELLPRLLERGGARGHGGAVTALYTVLVEGDDMNDPIADNLRAILDGHIVLGREIAHRGRYPAIDVTRSVSRLATTVLTATEQDLVTLAVQLIAAYEASRDLIEVGAYKAGTNPVLDRAMRAVPLIEQFIAQRPGTVVDRKVALDELRSLMARAEVPA